jgi:hypothetical protein
VGKPRGDVNSLRVGVPARPLYIPLFFWFEGCPFRCKIGSRQGNTDRINHCGPPENPSVEGRLSVNAYNLRREWEERDMSVMPVTRGTTLDRNLALTLLSLLRALGRSLN